MTSTGTSSQSSRLPASELWCEVRNEYFPPENEIVWTFDGHAVCPGVWVWDWEPSKTLADSVWKDTHGNRLRVTHWAAFEDSPYAPPSAPTLRPVPVV